MFLLLDIFSIDHYSLLNKKQVDWLKEKKEKTKKFNFHFCNIFDASMKMKVLKIKPAVNIEKNSNLQLYFFSSFWIVLHLFSI